jgi:hypothetical protein
MRSDIVIETNLKKAVWLYVSIIVITLIINFAINNLAFMIISIIAVLLFLQFIFSRQVFLIHIHDHTITFKYLQLTYKTVTYDSGSIIGKKRTDVKFRGGKDEILDIYDKRTNKRVFDISFRLFKKKDDFDFILNYLSDANT